jgi:hypothetical protein
MPAARQYALVAAVADMAEEREAVDAADVAKRSVQRWFAAYNIRTTRFCVCHTRMRPSQAPGQRASHAL